MKVKENDVLLIGYADAAPVVAIAIDATRYKRIDGRGVVRYLDSKEQVLLNFGNIFKDGVLFEALKVREEKKRVRLIS